MCNFVHEFPLKTTPQELKTLNIIFKMASFLYNAVLKEALIRTTSIKQSKDYKKAKKLRPSLKRTSLFKKIRKEHNFSDYALQKFAIKTKNTCSIKDHLDTHTCQKIATRAYNATNEYLLLKRGKPRFKRKNWLSSIEGKSNRSGIKFRKDRIVFQGLNLKIIFDKKDKNGIQAHSLSCTTKYVRLVRRIIKGKYRFFAQLVLEGKPLIKQKNTTKKEIVGLDIGPSTIAITGNKQALLTSFCENLNPLSKKIKVLQKKASRSLRLNNKNNYDPKGRVKKQSIWKKSKKYLKLKNQIYEYHRKLKESRKRAHNILANKILTYGKFIKTEKLSYRSFQKNFGKSINFRAPSMFVEILKRKAENAGGRVYEFSTKTCLSQICICKNKKKKKLSTRWHICKCGVRAQRDLFSSYLARYVENDILNISHAFKDWAGMNPFLEQAILRIPQATQGRVVPSSFGISQKRSLLVKDRSKLNEIKDVVGSKRFESF